MYKYTINPYGQSTIDKAKQALKQFSKEEVSETLKADQDALRSIVDKTFSYNSYLLREVTDFIDSLIEDNYIHEGAMDELLEQEIDRIYNPQIELSPEEQTAFAEFDILNRDDGYYDMDDTAVMTAAEESASDDLDETKTVMSAEEKLIEKYSQETFDKYIELKDSREIKSLDENTKQFEKAILLNAFHDYTRKHKALSSGEIEVKTHQSKSGSWNYTADNFVGAHTLGVNSDSESGSTNSKSLLGVIGDGATYAFSHEELNGRKARDLVNFDLDTTQNNLRRFSGHALANATTKAIAGFDFDNFQGEAMKFNSDFNSEQKANSAQAINILERITKDKDFHFDKDSSKGLIDQYRDHLSKDSDKNNSLIQKLNDPQLQLVIIAVAPLVFGQSNISATLAETYKDSSEVVASSMSLNYALELGNKVVLVKIGDSDIASYDKDGKRLKPESKIQQIFTPPYTGKKESLHAYTYPGEDSDTTFMLPTHIQLSVFDKDKVNQIVQISDGSTNDEENKLLPNQVQTSAKETFLDLLKIYPPSTPSEKEKGIKADYDDKAIRVLQKAS